MYFYMCSHACRARVCTLLQMGKVKRAKNKLHVPAAKSSGSSVRISVIVVRSFAFYFYVVDVGIGKCSWSYATPK